MNRLAIFLAPCLMTAATALMASPQRHGNNMIPSRPATATRGVRGSPATTTPMFPAPIDAKTGHIILLWQFGGEGNIKPPGDPFVLPSDYAILMVWGTTERNFIVADNRRKLTCSTKDFATFLKAVKGLPRGAGIQEIGACTASPHAAMPARYNRLLDITLKTKGQTLLRDPLDDKYMLDGCRYDGWKYPSPPHRAHQ